jgi:Coenzyme PQQ synthesis protein D (PqqD)
VFDPAIADLVQLTPTAGLLLELCGDGQVLADIQREFMEVVGTKLTPDEAYDQVQQGLRELVARGLVVTASALGP